MSRKRAGWWAAAGAGRGSDQIGRISKAENGGTGTGTRVSENEIQTP